MKFGEWIKNFKTWRRSALVALVLLFAVGWITVDMLFHPFEKAPTTVEIPDFCGLNINNLQAPEWLDVDIEYHYDENTPAGVVFRQTPTGGSRRRLAEDKPCQVSLAVSLGRESISLPSMIGRDVYEVATELRNLGLVVHTVMRSSPRAVGSVLASEPRAGESVPRGATITPHRQPRRRTENRSCAQFVRTFALGCAHSSVAVSVGRGRGHRSSVQRAGGNGIWAKPCRGNGGSARYQNYDLYFTRERIKGENLCIKGVEESSKAMADCLQCVCFVMLHAKRCRLTDVP